jgi:hypothetical protein
MKLRRNLKRASSRRAAGMTARPANEEPTA